MLKLLENMLLAAEPVPPVEVRGERMSNIFGMLPTTFNLNSLCHWPINKTQNMPTAAGMI